MPHRFDAVPRANIQRSSFNLSHGYKTTLDSGKLIPFLCMDIVPGDTVNLSATSLVRMATPIVPLMDNIYFDTFFFFVPYRLVWTNFVKMMGEREDPDDSIDYLIPNFFGSSSTSVNAGSVLDYFGVPIGSFYGTDSGKCNVSALPLRAYALIWNEWFRDENLQDSIKIIKSDYPGVTNDSSSFPNGNFHLAGSCLPRGKRKDYITGCLPWPQKGGSVDIPLGTSAPVYGTGKNLRVQYEDGSGNIVGVGGLQTNGDLSSSDVRQGVYGRIINPATWPDNTLRNIRVAPKETGVDSQMYADLSDATAATINSLRQAFQVQRMLEKDALGGSRYRELLMMHFGVTSPDARLQIPEYLGGSSTPFNINPVAQTASTDTTTPQGNLAAFSLCGSRGHGFTKSFTEHGVIIGLCSVRADLSYQQNLNRYWSKRTRYDFYWPSLAHLGEQAVLNKEVMVQGTSADDEVWGYQERYAEYRYMDNMITGKFRSTYSAPLDSWHLGQKFDTLPTLSDSFIREQPPISRVIAVPSEPEFLLDTWFNISAVRPMPVYGTPGMIDHF